MNECLILSSSQVDHILENLTLPEIHTFLTSLSTSLRTYSNTSEGKLQPEPSAVKHDNGRKDLFRLFTSTSGGAGCKIIVHPSEKANAHRTYASEAERHQAMGLHGILALTDQNGLAQGFINAEGLTAFRTAACSLLLYVRRQRTENVVIFGAGKVAHWTAKLLLSLRGRDIKRITFVNRSAGRTGLVLRELKKENEDRWKSPVEFGDLATSDAGHEGHLEKSLEEADAVFCTTASKEPLFPARWLIREKKSCYVSAIGSWQADMIELDPDLLKYAAQRDDGLGVVVVDSLAECIHASGEVRQSGLPEKQLLEVGQVFDRLEGENSEKLTTFLETGFVIYKSCGVGLTDLATGQSLLQIARERKMGTPIPDF